MPKLDDTDYPSTTDNSFQRGILDQLAPRQLGSTLTNGIVFGATMRYTDMLLNQVESWVNTGLNVVFDPLIDQVVKPIETSITGDSIQNVKKFNDLKKNAKDENDKIKNSVFKAF